MSVDLKTKAEPVEEHTTLLWGELTASKSRHKRLMQFALAIAFFIAALLAIELTKESSRIASIWFANAIVVAVLLRKPPSKWAGWLVAALIGNIAANLITGDPALQAVILSLCNTIEIILVCALASLGQRHDRGNLTELRSLSQYLLLGVVLGSAVAAFLASLTLNLLHGIPIGQLFWAWFIADALGLVIIVPLLVGVSFAETRSLFSGSKRWESISLVILVPALTFASFSLIPDQFHLLLLVLAVATTLRLGYVGATVYIFLMTIAGIISIVFLDGHVGSNLSLRAEISLLQLFSFINVLIILPIAILMRTAKNNELRYRNLVEGTTDLVTRVDMSGKFIFVNHMAEKVLGLQPEECVGLLAFYFVHKNDRESTQAWFDEWTKTHTSASDFENRQVNKKTSEVLWMLWTADMEFDDAGAPVAINSIGRDITKRKQAEESLREATETTARYLNISAELIFRLDSHGTIKLLNESGHRLLGYNLGELIGENWFDTCLPKETRGEIKAVFQNLMNGDVANVTTYENTVITKNGNIRSLLWHNSLLKDKHGRINGLLSSAQDITERKQAEEELVGTKFVLDTTTDAVYWMQQDGQFVDVNDAACKKLGYTRDELLAMHVNDMNPDYPADRWPATWELIKKEKSVNIEAHHKTKDGLVFPVEIQANYVQFGDKERICSYVRDITERKQAEEALRESEEKHRTLFETMSQGVVYQDADGKIISANTSAERILGISFDQMQGRSSIDPRWKSIQEDGSDLPGDSHPSMVALKTGQTVSNSIMGIFHPKEEETRWININAIPQFKPGQKKSYQVYTTFQDITDRKQADQTLKESEQKFKDLVFDMQVGVLLQGPQAEILLSNAKALELLGLTEDQLLGTTSFDPTWNVIHEDGSPFPGDTHPVPQAIALGEPVLNVIMGVFRPIKNDRVWLLVDAVPQLNDDDTVRQVVCTFIDMSQRVMAEELLRKSDDDYKSTLENLLSGVVVHGSDTSIQYSNSEANHILGLTEEQVLGKKAIDPTWSFLRKDLTKLELENYPVNKVISTRKPLNNYTIGINKPGQDFVTWVNVNAIPIFDDNHILEKVVVNFVDITERKQAEERRLSLEAQLRQSQKLEAIGTMVGGISHEFNNVLQSMFLYAGLVQDTLPDDQDLRANFQHILDDGNRARDLIKQVLTFSRKAKVEMEPQPLHDMIMDVLVLERASLPANIDIQQDIDLNCGPVLCDKTQIHQIMINLCNNAQHAMGEKGGTLTVSLKQIQASLNIGNPDTDVLELTVSDTGHGIDTADLEKIFDPFFTTKELGQGTGLGLSVIHGIVEMMEGHISVTSEIGKGTTFLILFPTTTIAVERNMVNSPIEVARASRCVLLADDEESIRSVTQIILTREGFKVDSASDGTQALELFKANPGKYDLIVTDQSMPKMSGVELTKAIRNTNSEIPIILSTGHLGLEEEQGFKDIGITAFIQKPWTAEELIKRIQELDDN